MRIVEYQPDFGEVQFPEGFPERLQGLSIEAQLKHFCLCRYDSVRNTPWAERERSALAYDVQGWSRFRGVVLREGIVVGAVIHTTPWGNVNCLVEERICYYDDDENNGAGYKSSEDYVSFLCMPTPAE